MFHLKGAGKRENFSRKVSQFQIHLLLSAYVIHATQKHVLVMRLANLKR